MSWTDEEARAFAAALIGRSESEVRSAAVEAGVDLRILDVGRSEWHTNRFQRRGITVLIQDGIATQATPG